MATSDRCPRCGALVLPQERFCAQCGAPLKEDAPAATASAIPEPAIPEPVNRASAIPEPVKSGTVASAAAEYAPKAPRITGKPETIEALRDWCAAHGMPLEKMRFFIGEDYRQPRAFGIYRDGDSFVVYKNKDNGSRAVRYQGPDEAYAVNELYQKLLSECHARGIYPDGKPQPTEQQIKARRRARRLLILGVIVAIVLCAGIIFMSIREHSHDGYYRYDDDSYYYRYGDTWYYGDAYDWVPVSDFPGDGYDQYYLGDDYDASWGGEDFRDSSAWEDIQSHDSSSDDYSSWDSGSTDWSSDW